jgi:hypothetical protein
MKDRVFIVKSITKEKDYLHVEIEPIPEVINGKIVRPYMRKIFINVSPLIQPVLHEDIIKILEGEQELTFGIIGHPLRINTNPYYITQGEKVLYKQSPFFYNDIESEINSYIINCDMLGITPNQEIISNTLTTFVFIDEDNEVATQKALNWLQSQNLYIIPDEEI